jgi:alkylhydroperoxidase family enzyme
VSAGAKEIEMQSVDTQIRTLPTGDPFLPPIENPPGAMMKFVYSMTRRQFGKVLTPLKVFAARMPIAFGQFYGSIAKLDQKLNLSKETIMLVRERTARLNVCTFCIDIGRFFAIKASANMAKFDALEEYQTNPIFSEKERALLDYVTGLVRDKRVERATFERLARHYTEREICEIVYVVASEHVYNMSNIGLNIHSDMLCDITKARKGA